MAMRITNQLASAASSERGAALAPFVVPIDMVDRIEDLARRRGCPSAVLIEELIRQALEQAESLPAARCSTRLGRCSVGPVPLPYQQR